MKKNQAK
jgi:hypothetical protein